MSNKSKKPAHHKASRNKSKSRKNSNKSHHKRRDAKQSEDSREINQLILKIRDAKPKISSNPFMKASKTSSSNGISPAVAAAASLAPSTSEESTPTDSPPQITKFAQLPLSKKLKKGLKKSSFVEMTDIQRESLMYSLSGYDVLAAAKTGSGKTLAFLIPIIENLFRAKWTPSMGLGALILVPTRELAQQVFDVLRTIGRYHKLSAGLVLGGKKNFQEESQLISHMNILVATPGRLLQHLDQSYGFNCDTLQMLILDEADRLLEMGFEAEIEAILQHLGSQRQTLLFSATQTTQIKQLARLSLKPKQTQFVSTIQDAESMPSQLLQMYTRVELYEKVDLLFSFLKKHTQQKTIVFVSTNAQVSFLYDSFSKLPLGLQVFKLKGSMSQSSRNEQFRGFAEVSGGVMFATDVAARGLDFPSVHFVIQMDIPATVDTYIHRSGRTARLKSSGYSIIFVAPQEEEFIRLLQEKNIAIEEKMMNPESLLSITDQLSSLIASNVQLKYLAMRYFEMFIKHTMKGLHCLKINVSDYPLKEFSLRLGLFEMPRVRLTKEDSRQLLVDKLKKQSDPEQEEEALGETFSFPADNTEQQDDDEEASDSDSEASSDDESSTGMNTDEEEDYINDLLYSSSKKAQKMQRENLMDRLVKKKNALQFDDKFKELAGVGEDGDDQDDDFFVVKRSNHELDEALSKKRDSKVYEPKVERKHLIARNGKAVSLFESVVAEKQNISAADVATFQQQLKDEISEVDMEDKERYLSRKRSIDSRRDDNVRKEIEAERRKDMQVIRNNTGEERTLDDLKLRSMQDGEEIPDDGEYSSDVSMDEESYQELLALSKQRISNANKRKFESLVARMDEGEDVEFPMGDDDDDAPAVEVEEAPRKPKKSKKRARKEESTQEGRKKRRKTKKSAPTEVEDQEALALQLLQGSAL